MNGRWLPLLGLCAPLAASAAAPELVPVAGYLTDDAGLPIDDQVVLDLRLYTEPTGGTPIWDEFQSIRVTGGQFTAYLGTQEALALEAFRDNGTLYLGLAVDGGAELTPRFELATAPFAAYAQYCDDAATVGGIDPADVRLLDDPVDWSLLESTSIPAGLADGDDDTTYTAGTGLVLNGTAFSADQAAIEAWATGVAYDTIDELRTQLDTVYAAKQSCTANQVLAADATGAWVCTDSTALPISEAAVDAAVGNNGYAADADLTTLEGNVGALQTTVSGIQSGGPYLPVAGGSATGAITAPRLASTGQLSSQNGYVRRDFLTWNTGNSSPGTIHIKTNIRVQSAIMYRLHVEGYNYGVGRAINSDAVGYTYSGWTCIGSDSVNNYASGVSLSQYCSSDGYVTLKLTTPSTYYIGFAVSGWFTNPTGNGHNISAQVFHQTADL